MNEENEYTETGKEKEISVEEAYANGARDNEAKVNEAQANETKSNIRRISGNVVKVSKIVKIFISIGFVACLVGGILLSVLLITRGMPKLLEDYPKLGEKIMIEEDRFLGIVVVRNPLSEYDEDIRSEVLLDKALQCYANAVILFLLTIVVNKFIVMFQAIAEAESPFNMEFVKKLKPVFIILVIICALESILLGVIIGVVMVCLYEMFKYGCILQKEADETL